MADLFHQARGAARYQLRVAGHLDAAWADWFGNCTITAQPDATTLVAVEVVDQAMLYGLIARVRDLGLTLISLQRADENQPSRTRGEPEFLNVRTEKGCPPECPVRNSAFHDEQRGAAEEENDDPSQ